MISYSTTSREYSPAPPQPPQGILHFFIYIYIYIYIERERERTSKFVKNTYWSQKKLLTCCNIIGTLGFKIEIN